MENARYEQAERGQSSLFSPTQTRKKCSTDPDGAIRTTQYADFTFHVSRFTLQRINVLTLQMAPSLLPFQATRRHLKTAMNEPIRILHLEDEHDFSELVHSLLQKEGIQADIVVVGNREQFEAALEREKFDVILADYLLPAYDGLKALNWVRSRDPVTPFLLVSGTIGEQAAIESLRQGATDYVLKMLPE